MPGEGFKALADPTRRRILELLREGNCTAGEPVSYTHLSRGGAGASPGLGVQKMPNMSTVTNLVAAKSTPSDVI